MKISNKYVSYAIHSLILLAVLGSSVLPAFGTTQRRQNVRRAPRRAAAAAATTAPMRRYTVEDETTIRVRMNQKISSSGARIGDRFTTTVVDPVYADGVEVIPAGSIVRGRVTSVRKAGRKSEAGTLGVNFVSLEVPNGRTYPINGSLTGVAGGTEEYDNEGEVTGRSAKQRNAVFIGGGAATGALIGAIAGGGKGAGIGAGVGAGLGVAGALFSRGKEAEVTPGTEFGVILNRSVTLPASTVR